MPINQSLRQLLYFKFTSNPKLLKRCGSLAPLLVAICGTYGFAAWFLVRCAMNEPDVSWFRNRHHSYSWSTVRPDYQYQLWEPYRDYSKLHFEIPRYEILEEWRKHEWEE